MQVRLGMVVICTVVLAAAANPPSPPLPQQRPDPTQEQGAPAKGKKGDDQPSMPGADAPIPEQKPEDLREKATPEAEPVAPPPAATPVKKDEAKEPANPAVKPDTAGTPSQPEDQAPATPPVEVEDAKAFASCLADLKAIGASFTETPKIDDGKGCGIDKPLEVTTVIPGVALAPKGTMRCETALELARWTKQSVLPAAAAAVAEDGPLTTINQASSYICRLRNNAATGKISEHARGNAIDIASFTFKSGKTIAIQPRDEDSTLSGAFQRAVTATGCLYFETVLDPGSDEAHENHLHFDVLQRKGGYRYCR